MMPLLTPRLAARREVRGFSLIEIVFVVAIIALLAAVALPLYSSYLARSQATELVLKYDAIRTNIQVAVKTGEVQATCATLAGSVHAANLQSDHAQLAVDFEPVASGYTPVLTMCASLVSQGPQGVEVTREAHNLFSRNSAISPGAVIGDSAASFSVKLAGDSVLCTVLPPASATKTACGPGKGSGGSTTGAINSPVVPASGPSSQPAKPPVATPSQPLTPASGPSSQPARPPLATPSQPVTPSAQFGPRVCTAGHDDCQL